MDPGNRLGTVLGFLRLPPIFECALCSDQVGEWRIDLYLLEDFLGARISVWTTWHTDTYGSRVEVMFVSRPWLWIFD